MIDPRTAMRATYARWLRVRVNVGALAASLAAAEHRLARDSGASADRADMATLLAQVRAERAAVDTQARELDARIADVKRACDALEADYVQALVAGARRSAVRERSARAANEGA